MSTFAGIPIVVNPCLPETRREQFRFPRSKKKRIRKKWAKDQRNWREVDARGDIYLVSKGGNDAPVWLQHHQERRLRREKG